MSGDWFAAQVRGTAPEPPPDNGFLLPPGFAEELMQTLREGFAAEDAWYDSQRRPMEPLPWRMRLRWRVKTLIWDTRHKAAWLAYRIIAGTTPETDYGGDE